jgi:hypothetical protein
MANSINWLFGCFLLLFNLHVVFCYSYISRLSGYHPSVMHYSLAFFSCFYPLSTLFLYMLYSPSLHVVLLLCTFLLDAPWLCTPYLSFFFHTIHLSVASVVLPNVTFKCRKCCTFFTMKKCMS